MQLTQHSGLTNPDLSVTYNKTTASLFLPQILFSDHKTIIHRGVILSRIFSTFKMAVR